MNPETKSPSLKGKTCAQKPLKGFLVTLKDWDFEKKILEKKCFNCVLKTSGHGECWSWYGHVVRCDSSGVVPGAPDLPTFFHGVLSDRDHRIEDLCWKLGEIRCRKNVFGVNLRFEKVFRSQAHGFISKSYFESLKGWTDKEPNVSSDASGFCFSSILSRKVWPFFWTHAHGGHRSQHLVAQRRSSLDTSIWSYVSWRLLKVKLETFWVWEHMNKPCNCQQLSTSSEWDISKIRPWKPFLLQEFGRVFSKAEVFLLWELVRIGLVLPGISWCLNAPSSTVTWHLESDFSERNA